MRITGSTAAGLGTMAQSVRRGPSGPFVLPQEEEATPRAAGAGGAAPLAGIETLLALQGVEDPTERRRRAVSRGRRVLDVLEEIRIALLAGVVDPGALDRLKATVGQIKEETGDPALDALLAEIELRAEVELAKAGL